MKRALVLALTLAVLAPPAAAQQPRRESLIPRNARGRGAVHYGKWLSAGAAVALTALAAKEHSASRRDWDRLLDICRSAEDACALAPDGRYLLYDAEFLYQRALYYDRRASHRLLGAQAGLLLTAALFILDRRPGDGPDNIPFGPLRVAVEPTRDGAAVGVQLTF